MRMHGLRRLWRRMTALRRRPAADRRLLWKALVLIVLVRLASRVLSLETVRRRLLAGRRPGRSLPPEWLGGRDAATAAPERVPWAVDRAAWLLPGTRCLPRALVAQALLAEEACESRLRIGARRDVEGRLHAHAWIEKDEEVLVGGEDSPQRYQTVPLSLFERAGWRQRIFSQHTHPIETDRIITWENEDAN